jgi:hypothetical protein
MNGSTVVSAIRIAMPTISKVRAAAQSLAGINVKPFYQPVEGQFHGLIDALSFSYLVEDDAAHDVQSYHYEGAIVFDVSHTGVTFRICDGARGAIIFGSNSDPLTIKERI